MDGGKTTMEYGLIGEKLGHSYSKLIQEKLLENYHYEIHPVEKENLDYFMKARAFKAINVTIPYKQDVIPYLDAMDEASQKIGAVNTIVHKDGKLMGHNTDYYGFAYMLKHHNIDIENKKVLVMGNGGASKAIQAVLHDMNAKEVLIVDLVVKENVITLEEAYLNHYDVDVIVNTTPVGMYPHVEASSVDISKFHQVKACVDVVYNPFATSFALQAKANNIKAVTGLEMLVAQAKRALEFFKDITIDDSEIERIYKEILFETCNMIMIDAAEEVLKETAEKTGKEIVLAKEDNIKEIAKKSNMIIACSSQMLDNTNTHELHRNGFFIYDTKNAHQAIQAFLNIIQTI